MRKGFMLTLDAFFALLLIAVVLVIAISPLKRDSAFETLNIRSYSMSMLASLEKSGTFAASLSNSTMLRNYVNELPPNMCMQLTVTNSSNATVLEIERDGCEAGENSYVAYRTFYTNGELYLARSKTWLR